MAKRVTPKSARAAAKPRRKNASSKAGRTRSKAPAVVAIKSRHEPAKPDAKAVALFEGAVKAMQRQNFSRAAEQFRGLIADFPRERALLDRARAFLARCRRELKKQPALQTIEERMTAATAALNDGDEAQAEALAKGVLADDSDHDLALYLLAAIEARRGRSSSALSYLGQAIELSPEASAQARFDDDFEALRKNEQFQVLTEPRGLSDARTPARTRRNRS